MKDCRVAVVFGLIIMMAGMFATQPLAADSIYVGNAGGTVYKVDPATLFAGNSLAGFDTIFGLGVQPDGSVAVVSYGYVRQINGDVTAITNTLGGFGEMTHATVMSNGNIVVTQTDYARINGVQGDFSGLFGVSPSGFGTFGALDVQPDNTVVVAGASGTIWRVDNALTGLTGTSMSGFGQISAIAVLSTGSIAVARGTTGYLTGVNSTLTGFVGNTLVGFGTISALCVQPDDTVVVANTAGNVWRVNSGMTAVVGSALTGFGDVCAMKTLSDGSIVVANRAGTLFLVNSDFTIVVTSAGGYGEITALAVSKSATPELPAMGANNKAVLTSVLQSKASTYAWVLWGKVSVTGTDDFTIDDGSGVNVKVHAPNHNIPGGKYASVKGTLDVSDPDDPVLNSQEITQHD